jgi:hypothetical protein
VFDRVPARARGHRVKAPGRRLHERAMPELAEGQESGFRAAMIALGALRLYCLLCGAIDLLRRAALPDAGNHLHRPPLLACPARRARSRQPTAETDHLMTNEIRFPRITALLTAAGHDPAEAAEILLDAQRNDFHARTWIAGIAASRWRRPAMTRIEPTLH